MWKNFHISKMLRRFNTKAAMDHTRVHKGGSGGVRLSKFCGQVTDYECAKEPLHDFSVFETKENILALNSCILHKKVVDDIMEVMEVL